MTIECLLDKTQTYRCNELSAEVERLREIITNHTGYIGEKLWDKPCLLHGGKHGVKECHQLSRAETAEAERNRYKVALKRIEKEARYDLDLYLIAYDALEETG